MLQRKALKGRVIFVRRQDITKVAVYAVVFGLVGGITFEGVNYTANRLLQNPAAESTEKPGEDRLPITNTSNESGEKAEGVSEVAANVLPSIVAIDVTLEEKKQDIFGRSYSQEASGSGSGIIVAQDEDNIYIATNNHVVSDTTDTGSYAKNISVTFQDESVYTATVKGTDSSADLAVVEIAAKDLSEDTKKNIKVATLGESSELQIGEQAIAIGNALGYGTSVTVGYISAVDREVASEDVNMKLIQTDAAINPGNSGGALVDSEGKVIGINSAKYSDTTVEGMGFAIPISVAVPIINDIVEAQRVPEDQQAYLGIKGIDVSGEISQYYNMPEGIYIGEVTEDAPADKAGMKKGDILVKFNGSDTTTMDSLQERLARCKAGDSAEVVVKRADEGEYKEETLKIKLGKKSEAEPEESSAAQDGGRNGQGNTNPYGNGQDGGNQGGNGQDSGSSGGNGFGRFFQ